MPEKTKSQDQFTAVIYASVTESAANTLTFQKIETGYGTLDKKAWRIERIEWYPSREWLVENIATDDIAQAAICTSNRITSLDLGAAALIDLLELRCALLTAVGKQDHFAPIMRDFSMLSGGGILVLPSPLYLAVKCTSHANPATASARIRFTEIELADNQWVELVEASRLLT